MKLEKENEEKLISELKKGRTSALDRAITNYPPYVSAVIRRIIGDKPEDCRELTADVFIALWENREKLSEGSLTAYLAAIARNKAFGLLRKTRDDLYLEEDFIVTGGESDPEKETETKDMGRLITEALMTLEKPQRELFIRHYYYGDTIKDAAEAMNINLSTAKSWLYRGKEVLKEYLEKNAAEYI